LLNLLQRDSVDLVSSKATQMIVKKKSKNKIEKKRMKLKKGRMIKREVEWKKEEEEKKPNFIKLGCKKV
jgi:hypothetical protein